MKQRPLSHRRASAYLRKRYLYPDDWMKIVRFECDRPIMQAIIDKWKSQIHDRAE